jgi:hypothetical protein
MKITTEHLTDAAAISFKRVPAPATNDVASTATFTLVEGERDRNGGSLDVLHDGRVPTGEDQPSANFFFGASTDGGRLSVDLGKVLAVKRVSSYSWHPDSRAPQVYQLYAADGTAPGFEAAPKRGTEPESCGWTLVARVDTRPAGGDVGGQHAVVVADAAGNALGRYRHLLFDISRTADQDPFGNTFFNEIEGIADYIRWFLYEPETKGAEITARNLERARYDTSYRITGNFLNWVTEHYDREIVRKLNSAAREGKYAEELWKESTGKTLVELGDAWKQEQESRLAGRPE